MGGRAHQAEHGGGGATVAEHSRLGVGHGLAADRALHGGERHRELHVEQARDGQRQRHKDGGREEHGGLEDGDEEVRREDAADILPHHLHAPGPHHMVSRDIPRCAERVTRVVTIAQAVERPGGKGKKHKKARAGDRRLGQQTWVGFTHPRPGLLTGVRGVQTVEGRCAPFDGDARRVGAHVVMYTHATGVDRVCSSTCRGET